MNLNKITTREICEYYKQVHDKPEGREVEEYARENNFTLCLGLALSELGID